MLHGRHPGVIDHSAMRTAHNDARGWLIQAAEGFADERTYLTQIAVAAGPVPITPGQRHSESAILSKRHSIVMLAQSYRTGCAVVAAFALVLVWFRTSGLLEKSVSVRVNFGVFRV